MTEPRNEERRTTFLRLLILLIILASFLVYAVLSQSAEAPPGPVPSVVTDVGLLITVILCVSISFWLTFAGNEAQGWKRGAWLFVGLICGAAWFLLLTLLAGLGAAGSSGWLDANGYTATIYNMSMAVWFMFGIAIILGVAAFLALVLILDSLEVAEAQARLQKK